MSKDVPVVVHLPFIINLQSPIGNPQSPILNRQSPIGNPQSSIPNRQSTIENPQSSIAYPYSCPALNLR
ncbi:MAG: hypothetical protein FJZ87_00130 [Chloroflexi bacterium]|nr:hypothetical protein [Chloroflexota bacterium]